MNDVSVRLITRSGDLPVMQCRNFFHSVAFFKILEGTSGMTPCMAVVQNGIGEVVAHMLAVISRRRTLLPPFLFRFAHVYGEGEYEEGTDVKSVFSRMLEALTSRFRRAMCLYCEFSELSSKMFGYGAFRANGYFPIPWQEVHNSLHSMHPDNRLGERIQRRVAASHRYGVQTAPSDSDADTAAYIKLLRRYFKFKSRRHIPSNTLFQTLAATKNGVNIVTKLKGRVIGGCTMVFSGRNAYMWFMASRRKSYHFFYPAEQTVIGALRYAYDKGYDHMFFLDAGLPFKRSPYREFVMSFGGKPVAKYHWFKFPLPWLNRVYSWLYNE